MAGIQGLDAFLAKIIKRGVADVNNDNKISSEEQALFSYMPEAKDLSDSLVYTNGEDKYEEINWADVNNKLKQLEKFGNLTMASSAAALMQSLDTDKDGKIETSEISTQSSNSNISNMNALFGKENINENMFNFTNMLNYAQLVNTDNDGKISDEEAKTFGSLVSSKNGVKVKNSDKVISNVDFLAAVKKHINGENLTAAQKEIIKNIQEGKFTAYEDNEKENDNFSENTKASLQRIANSLGFDGYEDFEYTEENLDAQGRLSTFSKNGQVYNVAYFNDNISVGYSDNGINVVKTFDKNNKLISMNIEINGIEISNATSYQINSDGTINVTFADGSKKVYNADGTEKVDNPKPDD